VQADAGPALRCRALAALAPHLFTTRVWTLGSQSAGAGQRGWTDVAGAIGVDHSRFVTVRQVHGARVVSAPDDEERGGWAAAPPEADIIVTAGAAAIAVQTADCVPLLMADRDGRAVAAVHAGWRGLAAGAPREAVRSLEQMFGVRPRDIVAAIGPAIGACCYQVGPDVRDAFRMHRAGGDGGAWFSPAPVPIAGNPPMPKLPTGSRADRWFFDGWAAARAQLEAAGVPSDQVRCASLCTASHAEVFCSYRRDGSPSGRMAAVIRRAR